MKYLFYCVVVLMLSACKENNEATVKTAPSQMEGHKMEATPTRDLNATETQEAVTFSTEEASMVYLAYLDLKASLVNTDATEAAKIAAEFDEKLQAYPDDALLMKLSDDLKSIKETDNAKQQRIAFEKVSYKIESYLSDKIASGVIFKQYCPMAFDGKGAYWLSNSEEVRNPYYGDVMLKCGVVDERLQ